MSLEKELPGPFREGIKALLRVLDPEDNSTGGGAASAVAGAMAAALLAMVARLSLGRPGTEPEEFYTSLAREGRDLAWQLMHGAQEDAMAFDEVMAAYRMPKDGEGESERRHQAIQEALEKATRIPLGNAYGCSRVLELCQLLGGRFDPKASSDFNCARHLAQAGLKGCLENVRINLPEMEDLDKARVIRCEAEALEVLARRHSSAVSAQSATGDEAGDPG